MADLTTSSAADALESLNKTPDRYATPESLKDLVRRVSVDTPGTVTMLYSGAVNADVSSNDLVVAISKQDKNVRIINNTDAAKLLDSDEFIKAVAKAHGSTPERVRGDRSDPGNKFLFDSKNGLWAETSERFVANTKTDVVTVTPYAKENRTFVQVELREALDNKDIQSINGIPKEVFQQIHKTTGSLEQVNKAVAASSFDRMQSMQAAVANDEVKAVDAAAFLGRSPTTLPPDVRTTMKSVLEPERDAEFAEGRRLLEQARLALKQEERRQESNASVHKEESKNAAADLAHSRTSNPVVLQDKPAASPSPSTGKAESRGHGTDLDPGKPATLETVQAIKLQPPKERVTQADTVEAGTEKLAAISKARAQAFVQKPAEDALKDYPELSGAYAAVAAMEKKSKPAI